MTPTPKDPVGALMALVDDLTWRALKREPTASIRAAVEASARALAAVPAPPLTMTGYQLREALEFLAPDGTAEQFEQEVCIQHGPERVCDAGTPDETTDPAGLYCWLSDCPEEGSIALTGEDARIRIETELISQQAGGVPAGWQPIETAPKDGRTLLLGRFNSHKKWRTMRGQWMSEEYIAEQWEEPENGEPGWFETAVEPDDVPNCWATEPTHWMPLPAEPGASPSPSAVQPKEDEPYQWMVSELEERGVKHIADGVRDLISTWKMACDNYRLEVQRRVAVQPLSEAKIEDGARSTQFWGLTLGEIYAEGARFAEAMHGIVTPKEPTP